MIKKTMRVNRRRRFAQPKSPETSCQIRCLIGGQNLPAIVGLPAVNTAAPFVIPPVFSSGRKFIALTPIDAGTSFDALAPIKILPAIFSSWAVQMKHFYPV
jgi:hypothetical protein